MLHVIGCITEQHDIRLVVLAALLCLFACITAMTMMARGRAATGSARTNWLLAAGLVAGCGIWGLHFVAMLAYRPGLPVAYDAALTALSIAIAASLCAIGFRTCLTAAGGVVGGAISGSAISAMHYVGMAAVRMPAHADWNTNYVAASLVIGIVATSAAMAIVMRKNDLRSYIVGGAMFAFGIVGMHFTAMAAVVYRPDTAVRISGMVIEPGVLAIAVAASVVLIMALGMVGAMVDHHLARRTTGEAARLRQHIDELETAKQRLEATSGKLRQALDAADAANEAKAKFLASMSHELRTPLNAVIGFAEMLQMEPFGALGDARYREYAQDIHGSGKHLLELINDILDISRIESGQVRVSDDKIEVSVLIDESVRMMSEQARRAGLTLHFRAAPDLPRLRADRRRIQQVLINLISNGIKFTPAGGSVLVTSEATPAGLILAVKDTGIGMDVDDIPKAFERFRQIDNSLARQYEGAGLGLALARDLVELHGGRLTLESELGAGTTANVLLPAERLIYASACMARPHLQDTAA